MILICTVLPYLGLGFSSSMPEAVIREKLAQEHARAKQQREKDVASNSDWFGQSNAFDSLLSAPAEGVGGVVDDGLSCLLANQGLSKYTDVFLRYEVAEVELTIFIFIRRHEVDLPTFATLTDEELKEIGIPTFGARKKLLLLARETRKKLDHVN